MVSESRVTPVVVSTGPSLVLLRPAGKVTSAPARAVSIGGGHVPPLQVQLPVELQLSLAPFPVQVTVDALNCRFHISSIIAVKRNAILDHRFL